LLFLVLIYMSLAMGPYDCTPADIWGTSSSNVFVVGNGVFHYDGKSWSKMDFQYNSWLEAISGDSPNNIYAVGGNPGYSGKIFHCNGNSWVEELWGPDIEVYESYLNDIWVGSPSNIFAVGINGTIIHNEGSDWKQIMSPTTSELISVWGISHSNVFAIGMDSTILNFNSSACNIIEVDYNGELSGVYGISSNNTFAYGSTLLQYNGSIWTEMTEMSGSHLIDMWSTPTNDLLAVSSSGIIYQYDGSHWNVSSNSETPKSLNAAWGTSPTDIFAISSDTSTHLGKGNIFHFDGNEWTWMGLGLDTHFWFMLATGVYFVIGTATLFVIWRRRKSKAW
ncbi:MAG: hypothetical protein U9N44_00225, partial [Chloroflexota bacterium]|nr:hypothetical protein [Chloroflexota bacterium]